MTIVHGEDYKAKTDWLDPLNRQRIQLAVRAKSDSVVLRDAREFALEYSPNGETVLLTQIKPKKLVPRGEFNIKKILDPLWVEDVMNKGVRAE